MGMCRMKPEVLPAVMGLSLLAVAAPALAGPTDGQENTDASSNSQPTQNIDANAPESVVLSPIVVHGHKIPKPVALQMVKNALHRSWSSAWEDRDAVVCRTPKITGSSFKRLRCETNGEHFRRAYRTQMRLLPAGPNGTIPAENVADELNLKRINVGALNALLAKLPPPGGSYTLQINDHDEPVSRWTFEDGELVKVWHSADERKSDSNKQ